MKSVYVAMSADFIHGGHLNILKHAASLGKVTVGLLTDKAVLSYKRLPMLNYEQRKDIIQSLKFVDAIVPQETASYVENLNSLKPDYVVHGDNWKIGPQSEIRREVVETLKKWDGELVELEYTKELDRDALTDKIRALGTTPQIRLSALKRMIQTNEAVRILEVHNGITGLIAENTEVNVNGQHREFHGMWESSLTDSTSKGKPDTGSVDVSNRVSTIDQILEVTTKPMIVDADNGGLSEHFCFTVRTLERLGVSAVIIEDKIGPKRNSLFGTDVDQTQDLPEEFAEKITAGKKAQVTKDFMIIARIESLILKKGQEDAMRRAECYVEAGADGIMIHSKEKSPEEVLLFCTNFRKKYPTIPLVVVPTSYGTIKEDELVAAGVNVVIYANHMLRSAFPAMSRVAESILKNQRCLEADEFCMPINQIINLIPQATS